MMELNYYYAFYIFERSDSPNFTRQNALFSLPGYAIACVRYNCNNNCAKNPLRWLIKRAHGVHRKISPFMVSSWNIYE